MHLETINYLQCPYCSSKFQLNLIRKKIGNSIEFATVYCRCDEFPIVHGILYLRRQSIKPIVYSIQNNQLDVALSLAINRSYLNPIIKAVIQSPYFNQNTLRYIFKLIPSPSNRYFIERQLERESLHLFLPLSLIEKGRKQTWFDIGSGYNSHLTFISKHHPHLTFISTDISFLKLLLTKLEHPAKNLNLVCADCQQGSIIESGTASVVTIIDTLSFVANQKSVVDQITTTGYLRQNGITLISSIPEKVYFPPKQEVYPIHRSLLSSWFPTPCLLLDDTKLSDAYTNKNSLILADYTINTITPIFRYALIWPKIKKIASPINPFIPTRIQKKATRTWSNAQIQFTNSIY